MPVLTSSNYLSNKVLMESRWSGMEAEIWEEFIDRTRQRTRETTANGVGPMC